MNLKNFVLGCETHRPVAIVLRADDYEQLRQAMPEQPADWNKEKMQYRGAPIARGEFFHSYIIEDCPDGPIVHMVG